MTSLDEKGTIFPMKLKLQEKSLSKKNLKREF